MFKIMTSLNQPTCNQCNRCFLYCFEQVWHFWNYLLLWITAFLPFLQLTSPLGYLHEFVPQAVHGVEVLQCIIARLIREPVSCSFTDCWCCLSEKPLLHFVDKGQHSKRYSYCGRFSGMWKFLPQDFVTGQLVDSREEWRSKWKKNPLEVINYPSLEVSDETKSVWSGGMLPVLALL